MDVVETLRNRIASTGNGEHLAGLNAVLGHIEVALKHLERGQTIGDESAFTDAIYRTNQAFEGGIKEAYRVLTGNDPQRKTPFKIEEYLETNNVFRERVMAQFRNYRTEWRNPSAHDYKLDFDEDEAFLAVVSVSAFACLLSGQMAEFIAYHRSMDATQSKLNPLPSQTSGKGLLEVAGTLIQEALSQRLLVEPSGPMMEPKLVGTIRGIFASVHPEIEVQADMLLSPDSKYRADLVMTSGDEKLVVEVKRLSSSRQASRAGRDQLERYLEVSGIRQGLLVYVSREFNKFRLILTESSQPNTKIWMILPES